MSRQTHKLRKIILGREVFPIELNNARFYNLLPPNLQGIESSCLSAAIDQQIRELAAYAAKRLYIYSDVFQIDDKMADYLALIFDIRSYRTDLQLGRKRKLVQNALLNYSRMGTAAAVEDVVASIYGGAEIQENWEYNGSGPYRFRIRVDASKQVPVENPTERLIDSVMDYKNVRSWLDGVRVEMVGESPLNIASLGESGAELVSRPLQKREAVGAATVYEAETILSSSVLMGIPKQQTKAAGQSGLSLKACMQSGGRLISVPKQKIEGVRFPALYTVQGRFGGRLICMKV